MLLSPHVGFSGCHAHAHATYVMLMPLTCSCQSHSHAHACHVFIAPLPTLLSPLSFFPTDSVPDTGMHVCHCCPREPFFLRLLSLLGEHPPNRCHPVNPPAEGERPKTASRWCHLNNGKEMPPGSLIIGLASCMGEGGLRRDKFGIGKIWWSKLTAICHFKGTTRLLFEMGVFL